IAMAGEMQIELGVPVAAPVTASGRVQPGSLPEGKYLVLRHTGRYDGLVASNAALQQWAREHQVGLDTWDTAHASARGSRAEHSPPNPAAKPAPAKWEVDVAYLTTQA